MNKNQTPYSWYDLTQGDSSYTYAVCRWGAGIAATTKALAGVFERLSDYQLDATRDMARLSRDPSRSAESYTTYAARMVQMQAEMQGSVEKLMREADLLYENLRREIDGDVPAPPSEVAGSAIDPSIRYGLPESQGVRDTSGGQFDSEQSLPSNVAPSFSAPPPLSDVVTSATDPAIPYGLVESQGTQKSDDWQFNPDQNLPPKPIAPAPVPAYEPSPAVADIDYAAPSEVPQSTTPPPQAERGIYAVPDDDRQPPAFQPGRDGYRRVARTKP